jgi:signal transduction histidine kinase
MSTGNPGMAGDEDGRRVLVLAPFGRDAAEICRVLSEAALSAERCADMQTLCREIRRGAVAAVLAEEVLTEAACAQLTATLNEEPPWSDFPLLVMTSRSRPDSDAWQSVRGIGGTAHLSLLERPLHLATLISAVRTAVLARTRQYEVRDALAARRQAEDELRETNRTLERRVRERTADLEARNRELQSFAYIASHDLREPLRKIQTFAGLLRDDAADRLEEEERHFLGRMESAAARMDGFLRDLLAFSRVATHTASPDPVRLDEVIRDVLEDYDLLIHETRAEVLTDAAVALLADRRQLRQLVAHLIGNALKFRREAAPPRLHIHATIENGGVRADGGGRVCRITVEDEGLGFDEKYAERIFEPFQRLHGRGVFEGTGMGLAICRRIVERHGGTITAESVPGEGSRFIVLLPVHQERP